MFIVEIVLDGFVCAKRCPIYRTESGLVDYVAIRGHFTRQGYRVGEVRGIADLTQTKTKH